MKTCGDVINKPLKLTFKHTLFNTSDWKKGNIVPVHKKGSKKNNKNYRTVSLLPICERILFNSIFSFFLENNLNTHKQSRFKTGDFGIAQLLSITYEIYKSFDDGFEVRRAF